MKSNKLVPATIIRMIVAIEIKLQEKNDNYKFALELYALNMIVQSIDTPSPLYGLVSSHQN